MNATDRRRNRELATAVVSALIAAGYECETPDGRDDSLYATISDVATDWSGTLRISEHPQPAGGGYSERMGCRHGEADISIIAQAGVGGDLAWGDNGKIVRVGRVRVKYDAHVPAGIRAVLDPVIADYAARYERRSAAAMSAAKTRRANRAIKDAISQAALAAEVRRELAAAGVTDIDAGDAFPRPFAPPGTPDRNRRLSAAGNQIAIICARRFAARRVQ